MRRLLVPFEKLFRTQNTRRTQTHQSRPRLQVEALEDRTLPSATTTGVVSGVAFVDFNQNGIHDPQEFVIPGVSVTLTGKTSQGTPVGATAVTDANGVYTFQNVQQGTY